jgi:hypothetical protein
MLDSMEHRKLILPHFCHEELAHLCESLHPSEMKHGVAEPLEGKRLVAGIGAVDGGEVFELNLFSGHLIGLLGQSVV